MSDIVLSAGVRQNLLSLQNTADLITTTQNRLATGKKVNSALDNPTNFFTASALQSRARDLSFLLDGMSNGIKTLEAADNGLTSITKTLESMQSTLRQARQDKSFETSSYTIDETAIGTATLKNIQLSGGSLAASVNVALQVGAAGTQANVSGAVAYENISPAASSPVLTASSDFVPLDVADGDETYGFDVNGDTIALTAADDTDANGSISLDEAVTKINADLTTAVSDIRARNNAGKLEFYDSTGTTGSANTITVDTFTSGGTTPSAETALGFGSTLNATQAGTDDTTYSFTVSDGTTQITVTLDQTNGDTLANAIDSVNSQLGDTNAFEAYDDNGKLAIREKEANGATLTVAGTDAVTLFGAATTADTGVAGALTVRTVDELVSVINNDVNLQGSVRASNDNGKLRIENLSTQDLTVTGYDNTSAAIDGGVGTSTIGGNTVRADLATQFNELRDQLDKLSDDASFNGINLLRGDNLTLTFNETGTSTIDIQTKNGETVNAATLGISDLDAVDLDLDTNIDSLLAGVKDAINQVRSQSSAFGSNLSIVENRQDFTERMMNTLQTGGDNLVLADGNEEAANMLALQTRQQLSTTALSLASQADQAPLSLF